MAVPSRELAQAARRFADRNSARLADVAGARLIITTVQTVTVGGASDGNALVTVLWRGQEITTAGYPASYTPTVGDRVLCALVESQLLVVLPIIGQP